MASRWLGGAHDGRMMQGGSAMGALPGLRILDFTQMMFGPFATQMLGDVGADVIKIERPTGEWERGLAYRGALLGGTSPYFLAMNRNKRSLALDLKRPEAIDLIRRLVTRYDVVVSNFRPGVMERMGLGYEALRKVREDVIVVEGSGWGADGPYVARPGQDLLVQSVGGLAASSGRTADPPTPTASSVADAFGALHLALAVVTSYAHRLVSGQGQLVRVNLLDSLISVECQEAVALMNMGGELQRPATTPGAPWLAAPFGVYRLRDGYVAIAMADFRLLAEVLGAPDLATFADERRAFEERDAAHLALQAALAERDLGVLDDLLAKDVWCAKVQDLESALADPQVLHNGMIWEVDDPRHGRLRLIGHPVHYGRTPASLRRAAPSVGEHSWQILEELGLSSDEADRLAAQGVVYGPRQPEIVES